MLTGSRNIAGPPAETQTTGDSYEFIQIKTPLSLDVLATSMGNRLVLNYFHCLNAYLILKTP